VAVAVVDGAYVFLQKPFLYVLTCLLSELFLF